MNIGGVLDAPHMNLFLTLARPRDVGGGVQPLERVHLQAKSLSPSELIGGGERVGPLPLSRLHSSSGQ